MKQEGANFGKQGEMKMVMPFFIVESLQSTLEFYQSKLGFYTDVAIPEAKPFFAIVRRDDIAFMLKEIAPDIHPIPNHTQHEWAGWDAYVYTPDPDTLYEELRDNGVEFKKPIENTDDGLRAFEVRDNNDYIICFGKTLES